MSIMMFYDVLLATGQTLYMVLLSTIFAILLGLPLGTLLFTSTHVKPNRTLNRLISGFINISRSIPFIILLVALIPFTRLIVGTSIGLHAAIVPLTIGATPFYAMGASTRQMIRYILIPEALPALIHAVTVTAITLVNYSAMAGTVGGGGLGDLAIRYGYQRFNVTIMIATVVILIVIVQLLQMGGDRLSRRFIHH
jgi:D-methionine transport system permease protein